MYYIELSDEAISDYENAVAWYEAQKPRAETTHCGFRHFAQQT